MTSVASVDSYLKLILTDRSWSWTLIVIGYLIVTLLIRQCFFRMAVRETKEIDPGAYRAVKNFYLRKSIGGWILYLISVLLVITFWILGEKQPIGPSLLVLISFLLPTLFFTSIALHLTAFIRALLASYRQKMGVDKEF